jgi:hypothetical protein
MKTPRRNPQNNPHRTSSWRNTEKRVEQYYGKQALVDTWEMQSEDAQVREHDYLLELRSRVRTCRNLVLHRADPHANI